MSGYYRIGADWSPHGEVLKRVHPANGEPIQTPALDEIVKWALDRLSDEEINQATPSPGAFFTPLEEQISYLQWEQVVDALEELWELGGPCRCGYIDAETRRNPMLMFPALTIRHQVLGPRDVLKALLAQVVRTRINAVGRDALWANSPFKEFHAE